jgi:hypothetical protein
MMFWCGNSNIIKKAVSRNTSAFSFYSDDSIKKLPNLLITAILILSSCKGRSDIERVIQLAEENGTELEAVLDHYKDSEDSLKLKAANFLIVNMVGKGSFDYYLTDSLGKKYDINLFDYEVYDSMKKTKSDLEHKIGRTLKYSRGEFVADLKIIKSEYLIDHIERTFDAWSMPWAKHLNFSEFCEALLPYRINNEPLPQLSPKILKDIQHFKNLKDSIDDPVIICSIINDSLKKTYAWRHKETSLYPGPLSFADIDKINGGRCEDLNALTALYMRSAGVPVYSESTPFWGNSDTGGHSWPSVVNKQHEAIPFTAAYDNPVQGKLPFGYKRLAKSYRKNYQATFIENQEKYETYLDDPSLFDNTHELIDVFDYNFINQTDKQTSSKKLYLGILNGGNWRIIAQSEAHEKVFKNLGKNVIYLPLTLEAGKEYIIGDPFVYQSKPDSLLLLNNNSNRTIPVKIYIGDFAWGLKRDREYQLYCWDQNQWRKLEYTLVSTNDFWSFKNINTPWTENGEMNLQLPENKVFRFVDNLDNKDWSSWTRPFIFLNGKCYQY